MALFKIFKGSKSNLGKTGSITLYVREGFAYFTPDDGKFYIDIAGSDRPGENKIAAEIGVNRIPLNAAQADYVKNNFILKISNGDIENNNLYTFNGSETKQLNIIANNGINFTSAQNSLTIGINASAINTGILPTAYGGTGNNTYVANRLIYSETANKLNSINNIGVDGNTLSFLKDDQDYSLITNKYNNIIYPLLRDHHNGNISLSASSGGLYVGYANTQFTSISQRVKIYPLHSFKESTAISEPGWIRIASLLLNDNNHFDLAVLDFTITRSYKTLAPETYTIRVTAGWQTCTITQVGGSINKLRLSEFRVVRDDVEHKAYFEIYLNATPANNTIYISTIDYTNKAALEFLSEPETKLDSELVLYKLIKLKTAAISSNKSLYISDINQGLFLTDSNNSLYGAIFNNDSNLWIGATATNANIHTGGLYFHAGKNASDIINRSAFLAVGNNDTATTATNYVIAYGSGGGPSLPVYVDTYGKVLSITETFGTSQKPIWIDNGVIKAVDYMLNTNVAEGSIHKLAYYSANNTISAGSISLIDYVAYTTLTPGDSSGGLTFHEALIKHISQNYPLSNTYIGEVVPNSRATLLGLIYNINEVDSTTNLPRYSTFLISRQGGELESFGTSNYNYFYRKYVYNSGTWDISITGNANTATAFASDATISLTGDITGFANGTHEWSINTTIGAEKVTNAMLKGFIENGKLQNSKIIIAGIDVPLGGSISLSLLGLSSALRFKGITITTMVDGRTTADVVINDSPYSPIQGDVVLYEDGEYVWTGDTWEELGRENSFKIKLTEITKPANVSNKWVSSIGQNANGNISVSYTTLDTTGIWSGNAATATKVNNILTITLNNSAKTFDGSADTSISFYAPTSGGTANTQALVGNGATTAPKWVNISPSITITAGTASATPKVNVTVLGQSGTALAITTATTGVYGATKLTDVYTSTDATLAATGKSILAAIQTLDVAAVGVAAATGNRYISLISETDGKISAILATATIGTATRPIWIDAGTIKAGSYELKATVEDGSASHLAYYSTARTIDYTPNIIYYNDNSVTTQGTTTRLLNGLLIAGLTSGNTASHLVSNTAGVMRFGDGGPQLIFSEATSGSPAIGSDAGAILFTNHDSAGVGSSFHFVGKDGNDNLGGNLHVTAPNLIARKKLTIGSNFINTSYTLYTRGIANFNIAADNAYGINGHRLNAIFEGTTNASILIATPTTNHAYGIAVNLNGNMYIGYRNNGSYTSYTGDVYSLILNKNVSFYPSSTDATNLGTTDYFWKTGYINNIYLGNKAGTANAGIYLRGSKDNPLDRVMIEFLVNTADGYGHGIKIGNGGVTVIGAGESARSLSVSANSETMYVLSDGAINIEAGADAIANRKGVLVTTGGHLVPVMAEVAHPHAQNLGAAANNWYDIFARNHTLYANNAWYGDFHISVLGTTDTPGVTLLRVGNNVATGTANNSLGKIRLYAANTNYTEILSQGNGSRTFYLPNYAGTMYAIHAAGNDAIGNTTTPIYVAANGRVTVGYPYLRYINSTDVTTYSVDELGKTASIAYIRATDANAPVSGHMMYINAGIGHMGTPFLIGIHDSDNLYIYKRWYSSSAWSAWTKMRAGYADTAGAFSSNATVTLTGDTTGTSAGSTKSWTISTKTDRLSTEGDNRSVATTPNNYNNKFIFRGLKTNSSFGSPSSDTFSYVIGLRGWADSSGGDAHELAFNNTGIFWRHGATTSWGSWNRFVTNSGTWGISITGNAATATKLSNTPNNTTTFLRGDNTWSNTLTGTLILSRTTDASGTADNKPALIVGGLSTASHIEIDSNEILAKSDGTTPTTLYLQDTTGAVSVSGSGGLIVSSGDLTISSTNKYIYFNDSGTATRGIQFRMGTNDYGRLVAGATAANAGWLELATADDGNEPIYVRLYTGTFATITHTLTLLDANGDTTIPGKLFIQLPDTGRDNGIIGTYNYKKAAAIWSMGSAYLIAADGSGLGTLYGAAYGYGGQAYLGNNSYAGGHQFLWCQNGAVNVALGNNIWTSGNILAGTTSSTAERQVHATAASGDIYIYSQGSATGAKGIYFSAHGSSPAGYVAYVDSAHRVYYSGNFTSQRVTLIANQGSQINSGVWLRTCIVQSYLNYANFLIRLTGGWSTGSPTIATIDVNMRNGLASMKLVHRGFLGTIGKVKLVKLETNTAYLDVYIREASNNTAYFGQFIGNVTVTQNNNTTHGTTNVTTTDVTGLDVLDLTAAVGNASTPVYIDATGNPVACTAYNSATNIRAATVNINNDTTSKLFVLGATTTGYTSIYRESSVYMQNNVLMGAAWNDYAEFRQSKESKKIEPGRVVYENGDDTLSMSNERLMRGCSIVSDTYGFGIGESEEAQLPIAVSGRVLAYPYENKEEFKTHIGWPVCSGPNGTVSIMTEEEEIKYPSRIIGTISAVPDYEIWHGGVDVIVDGRVWIKVR